MLKYVAENADLHVVKCGSKSPWHCNAHGIITMTVGSVLRKWIKSCVRLVCFWLLEYACLPALVVFSIYWSIRSMSTLLATKRGNDSPIIPMVGHMPPQFGTSSR